jgi:hypothetical protein
LADALTIQAIATGVNTASSTTIEFLQSEVPAMIERWREHKAKPA